MNYHLDPAEKLQYALINSLLDPSVIGKQQLEKAIHKPVTITSITTESASIIITDLATQTGDEYVTPSFEYVPAESLLDEDLQWIAKKFKIDFIPRKTTITFPDGFHKTFNNIQKVPSLRHRITSE